MSAGPDVQTGATLGAKREEVMKMMMMMMIMMRIPTDNQSSISSLVCNVCIKYTSLP